MDIKVNGRICSLKYSKKRDQYENSTKSCVGYIRDNNFLGFSYDICMYKVYKLGDKNYVFKNETKYSNTTSKHSYEIYELIKHLYADNIERSFSVTNIAFSCEYTIKNSVEYYEKQNEELLSLINKKGTRKKTNEDRKEKIEQNKKTIEVLTELKKEAAIKFD